MALTKQVTKSGVREIMPKLFGVSYTLTLKEDDEVVLTQQFQGRFRPGGDLDAIPAGIIVEMQSAIDKYKREQVIATHPKMDASVVTIQAGLEV